MLQYPPGDDNFNKKFNLQYDMDKNSKRGSKL